MVTSRPRPMLRTRDAAATRDRILAAVGTLLAREGFAALGVNAIAREAGVDKVLIYRYFGGLEPLLEAFGQTQAFWPTFEELAPDPASLQALPPAERSFRLLRAYLHALRRRPLTLEIMAWETVARSPLTTALEQVRETLAQRLMADLGADAPDPHRLAPILALLGAGLNHLVVRSRQVGLFNGVDLQADTGWTSLEAALQQLCQGAFPAQP